MDKLTLKQKKYLFNQALITLANIQNGLGVLNVRAREHFDADRLTDDELMSLRDGLREFEDDLELFMLS